MSDESIYTATLNLVSTQFFLVRTNERRDSVSRKFNWLKQFGGYSEVEEEKTAGETFQTYELWLSQAEADEAVLDPTQFMTEDQKELFKNRHRDWELFVTEHKPGLATRYDHADADGKRKALRKAAILARMSAEDRALFR